eukprot:m.24556 g.24556  ORF g.24556 m.24556 type:complete len:69 (+) comp4287_c0_seq1:2038-2244(+)
MSSRLQRALVRAVPTAFVIGAAIEAFMIRVRVGEETFYDTAIRLEAQRRREAEAEAAAAASSTTSNSH